jgi:hypothetical protein
VSDTIPAKHAHVVSPDEPLWLALHPGPRDLFVVVARRVLARRTHTGIGPQLLLCASRFSLGYHVSWRFTWSRDDNPAWVSIVKPNGGTVRRGRDGIKLIPAVPDLVAARIAHKPSSPSSSSPAISRNLLNSLSVAGAPSGDAVVAATMVAAAVGLSLCHRAKTSTGIKLELLSQHPCFADPVDLAFPQLRAATRAAQSRCWQRWSGPPLATRTRLRS